MNQALQSYTPLPHPLNYDALGAKEGCEPESGVRKFALEAFSKLCIYLHDPSSAIFNQSPLAGVQVGPTAALATEDNHNILWTAWQATKGIRIGIGAYPILPADNRGQESGLFPTIKTTKVTLAFTKTGLLAIAINKPVVGAFIQLKRYTNGAGAIQDVTFAGYSPLLVNTWNLNKGSAAQTGLVCIYLRPNFRSLFARFEVDSFATEYEILPDMRVAMAVLLQADFIDGRVRIFGLDTAGRDIIITSDSYPQTIALHKATVGISMPSGAVQQVAVQVSIPTADKSTVGLSLDSGSVTITTVEPEDDPVPDASAFDISLDSGEINTPA